MTSGQRTRGPSRVPPGPRGYPLVGVFPMARRDPLKFFLEAARQYGDLVSVRLGPRRAYLVSHPDHIRHILQDSQHIYCKGPPAARVRPMFGESLTTIDGERWQHRRRLMLPAFHPQRLLALGPVITETTAAMLDRWERFAARSQPLDVLSEMTDLTRLIIVRAVLGDVTPEEARAVGRTLDSVFERTDERLWSALPWAWHFLGPRSRQSPRALRALDAFVRGKIEDSRRRSLAAPNLASTLLDAPDPGTGQGMSGAELRNEIHTDADFWRLTLAYERKILQLGPGGTLVGSAGLTYVYFNPKVNGNPEDFYLQELPVPVLGLRMDYPLGDRLFFTASLAGGVLPRVDSGRKEGGTVFLQQSHADASLGLTYALTPALHVHASYRLRYFTQHELSHEDNNAFLLLDNGFRLGLSYRF